MILRAKFVLPMEGPPVEEGAVVIQGSRIEALGPWKEIAATYLLQPSPSVNPVNPVHPVIDLGRQTLLPGLINAHCHLDYTLLRKAIDPPASFSQWIERINGVKRSFYPEDYLRSILLGFQEARKWGTTSLLNIESFPDILSQLPPPLLRTWWFFEMIDLRSPIESLDFGQLPEGWLGGQGLSPHAPYTASRDLYARSAATGQLITTHLCESEDENNMFRHGSGGLYQMLEKIGRDMSDCGSHSPLKQLEEFIDSRWIIAHLNSLDEEDFSILARRRPHIAHCPCSHQYFRHPRFEYKRLRDLGLNLCLGTDSLASNGALNLFAEMRLLQENQPWMSAEEILQTVTLNPAAALGCKESLGKIAPGALADLICIPAGHSVQTIYDDIVQYRKPVKWAMVNGKLLEPKRALHGRGQGA